MKIAIISAANNVHTMRWANAMSERGHCVTVISCKNHRPDKNIIFRKEVNIMLLRYSSPFGYYLNAGQLKKLVKREKFDNINIHYASGYGTLGRRAKLKNALLNIWGSDVYDFPYQSKFNMRTIKKNLAYFNHVASTSNCMAVQAKKLVDREYFITPFGVDTERFKPIDGLKSSDKLILGTVKTLRPNYGISDTIKAFIKLINRLKNEGHGDLADKLYYEIYGKGPLKEELQRLIDENSMTDKISLCGFIPNEKLPEIINRFLIFNCNSIIESFGVAAVESMACGVPVQASDADGFVEVVEDGITGLISPKGDIDAIAENMYKLLIDEELRNKMSICGVKHVKLLYNWQDNVDRMENIYKSII